MVIRKIARVVAILIVSSAVILTDGSLSLGDWEEFNEVDPSAITIVTATLSPGNNYRLIVTGTYVVEAPPDLAVNPTSTADAECTSGGTTDVWLDNQFLASYPNEDFADLYVNGGKVAWTPYKPDISGKCSQGDPLHGYFYDFGTPATTQTVSFTVYDDDRALSGSLYVKAMCKKQWPAPGTEFMKQAAINNSANEVTMEDNCSGGSVMVGYNDGVSTYDLDYPCPKYTKAPLEDSFQSFGYLSQATLTVDSRDAFYDPVNPYPADGAMPLRGYTASSGYYSDEEVHYKQSGHWGIQTCNWLKPGETYRITVKGTYKYDQTQQEGYGEADAECATGFKDSDGNQFGITTTSTSESWPDKYVPAHYKYALEGEASGINNPVVNPYGDTFDDHRFDYTADNLVSEDGFDLQLKGWAQGPVTWTALNLSGGSLVTTTAACSSIHTYTYDLVPTSAQGRPLHFVLKDFLTYSEWENCGTLSVRITTSTTGYLDPPDPPYSTDACHYVPDFSVRTIYMTDLEQNEADPADDHLGYFNPEDYVIGARWFDFQTGVTSTATVQWGNLNSVQPHSATAAVRKSNGAFCTDVVIDTASSNLGRDDCDSEGVEKLFDSGPDCPGDAGECTTIGEGYVWGVAFNPTAQSTLCDSEYCAIPYYCRVRPDFMRGTLVIRRN